jgi:hypothetical protein
MKPSPRTFLNPIQRILSAVTLALGALLTGALPASGALIDLWRADDLALNDGDTVSAWISASNRNANSVAATGLPVLKRGVTLAGGNAVRFNRNRMSIPNSPVGGRTAFSIAYVFKADALGANDAGANWYGKTGIVDAEQGGIVADWGTVLTETGQVGIGSGNPDISTYSTGASLVDGNYHVALFTWGGGSQSVYVDFRPPVTQAGVASASRNSAAVAFGGIATDENRAVRRLVGDLVEIRFYDTILTSAQASNLTFAIVMSPAHGGLSGTPPNVTYTPALNFSGDDAFTFKVNDGTFDSAPGDRMS